MITIDAVESKVYLSLSSRKLYFPFGHPPEGEDVLWRCESKQYSYIVDAEREEYGVTNPRLELCWFSVRKRTPHGAWIKPFGSDDRFVKLTAKGKKYATETVAEAVDQFKHRKRRYKKILEGRLRTTLYELAMVESFEEQERDKPDPT